MNWNFKNYAFVILKIKHLSVKAMFTLCEISFIFFLAFLVWFNIFNLQTKAFLLALVSLRRHCHRHIRCIRCHWQHHSLESEKLPMPLLLERCIAVVQFSKRRACNVEVLKKKSAFIYIFFHIPYSRFLPMARTAQSNK